MPYGANITLRNPTNLGLGMAPPVHNGPSSRTPSPRNPYGALLAALAGKMGTDPNAANWQAMSTKAMGLGNRDYTEEMRRRYLDDVSRQEKGFDSSLRAGGVGELKLAEDVQHRWAKERQDASSQASVQGAQMQQSALSTATQMLQTASGQNLDYMLAQLQAILGGSSQWLELQKLLAPLMLQAGQIKE